MRRAALLLILLIVVAGLNCLTPVSASAEKFDFEDLPVGTVVRAQYGPRGVIFFDAYLDQDPHAHSGTRVLRAVSPSAEVFTAVPLAMTFTSPQAHIAFQAGNAGETRNGTLKVFDVNGTMLAQDGPKPVPSDTFAATFNVQLPIATIVRAEFQVEESAREAIDDLVVEGNPASLPKKPPVVTITNPSEGAILPEGHIVMRGTVTGDSVLDPITLRVTIGLPGDSTAPPSENAVSLSGSGTSRTFSFDYGALTGPYTVTALATNTANLLGLATVHFSSLPDSIGVRYKAAGGAPTFGALRFGASETGCVVAVYDKGLIAAVGNQTYVVQGAMFQKWMATREAASPMSRLGCPTAEARDALAGARAQDFKHGRIYTTASSAAYVPGVFRDAIESLGGEATTGIATSDPTSDSRPVFATWLFQRFVRKGVALPSTLEIRGDPPRLYVERQAGDGSLFAGVLRPTNPTIFESFACSTTAGPCAVAAPPEEPLFTRAAGFCHNKEFNWKAQVLGVLGDHPDPPEWVPIRGDYVQVPIWGALFDVHLAHGDNPFTHRNPFEPCPGSPALEALINETICPTDWDLKIRPLPGFRSLQPVRRDAVQIEFERVDFQHQMAAYGDPTPGDLVFAAGRYVVDCGHGGDHKDSFKTEIHPPSVYAAVSSVTRNGRPATQADIWVNWFFVGGDAPADAVEFDVYPPPRPSPQATLGASTPGDQNEAVRVAFKPIFPFGPVRVRITATRGTPEITKYGEMKPRNEDVPFGFDGRLHVYWNCQGGRC